MTHGNKNIHKWSGKWIAVLIIGLSSFVLRAKRTDFFDTSIPETHISGWWITPSKGRICGPRGGPRPNGPPLATPLLLHSSNYSISFLLHAGLFSNGMSLCMLEWISAASQVGTRSDRVTVYASDTHIVAIYLYYGATRFNCTQKILI